jgi:hypothetical protein
MENAHGLEPCEGNPLESSSLSSGTGVGLLNAMMAEWQTHQPEALVGEIS